MGPFPENEAPNAAFAAILGGISNFFEIGGHYFWEFAYNSKKYYISLRAALSFLGNVLIICVERNMSSDDKITAHVCFRTLYKVTNLQGGE